MRKHLQSLFTFGFFGKFMLATSQIQFDSNCDNCSQMLLEEQQKNGFMVLLPCISPLCCLFLLPFWINNKLAATKISGLHGRWALECLKISCCILSFSHRPKGSHRQLCSSCAHKIIAPSKMPVGR